MPLMSHYPVFEANQVLTNRHLNDVFGYLDQETRSTRSNLIGIGIVCGLEIAIDAAGGSILLSKGCGVTSEGYLILEPDDVALVAYRTYTPPTDIDYPPFKDAATKVQFPLWELFPAGEPNTTALTSPGGFLDDKAVVLFLELDKQDVRTCSPNNCDDKGAEIAITVRRLLIAVSDLEKIIAEAGALGSGLTSSDLGAALGAKLDLPDLHSLRFDVLNSGPVTSHDVYAAFLQVFRAGKAAQATETALSAAYAAFKPVLQRGYPADPFGTFNASFAFLDNAPTSTAQVRFLQYYVDLFEDLLRAYDEFRWKGAELLCVCCPPEGLFPRHLMLGLLRPEQSKTPAYYRQPFLPSPAVGCCAAESRALLQLFARLVEMAARFSHAPSLPKADAKARIDPQIRITPSVLGNAALQARAIPYYYQQNGKPPLYQLWNGEKTRRNRANHNLSYRADEYTPPAPAFAGDPLRYDLEPYNFLRVEGHLGKGYQSVLTTLLQLKSQYRLPIDIIALRTGAYDDTQPVDLTKETARFQDLEALYDALREELLSSLAAGAMNLYDVVLADSKLPGGIPKLPIVKDYAPNYRYRVGTVGAFYEQHLQRFQATPYIDVDQRLMSDPSFANQVLQVYCVLFTGVTGLPPAKFAHVVCLYYFSKLAEILPATLNALAYADFENKYQDLLALARYFRSEAIGNVPPDLKDFVPQEELIDEFDHVLFSCKLEPIQAVNDEYVKRLGLLKKRQFLSNFLQQHPGIQHKAGVPVGGTFIVVYHQEPAPPFERNDRVLINAALFAEASAAKMEERHEGMIDAATISQIADLASRTDVKGLALTDAITRVSSNKALAGQPDIEFILGSLTGRIPMFGGNAPKRTVGDEASKIITAAVSELTSGTVIADFFLPYRIASDCPGIEFVLPKTPPSFTADAACANPDGIASVRVTPKGGTAPYDISVDENGYQALGEALSLRAGTHALTIRDADGVESSRQTLVVPAALAIGAPEFVCADMQFTAAFEISGGTVPYTVNGKELPANQSRFTTDPVPSGTSVSVVVTDSRTCATETSFSHTCPPACELPCKGLSLNRRFRFWMPEADPNNPYRALDLGDLLFVVENESGTPVDLSAKIRPILKATARDLAVGRFQRRVETWIAEINKIIASTPGLSGSGNVSWLTLSYEPLAPGRLGLLSIEYFECLRFEIRLSLAFTRNSGSDKIQVGYSPDGTSISTNDVKVPPFDGRRIDKCNPNVPPERLCPARPDIALKIDPRIRGRAVQLEASASVATELTFFWEVQDATPPIGNGKTFSTTFNSVGEKLVTVTAFTKAGCSVAQSAQIVLEG